jgi:hypothetical protein
MFLLVKVDGFVFITFIPAFNGTGRKVVKEKDPINHVNPVNRCQKKSAAEISTAF